MAKFSLHIWSQSGKSIPITAAKAQKQDLSVTTLEPKWQTDWTSDYITSSGFDIYAFKTSDGELVSLAVYECRASSMGIHILYMESQSESNPTCTRIPKYRGIGRAMIAYGIKLSVDAGFNGDVTLDAKTSELARHYEHDFGAVRLPGRDRSTAPRYLICDEAAQRIFTDFLEEV